MLILTTSENGQGDAHEKVILSIKDQVLAMLEKATAWDVPGKEYVFNVETSGHFDSSYGNSTLKIGQVELAKA